MVPRPESPRFVCDMMLGRLMRWLRILGYDALYPVELDDPELAQLAAREGRILLTRDRALSETSVCETYYVDPDTVEEQLVAVLGRFGLESALAMDDGPGFTFRCSKCNAELSMIPKTAVEARVPAKVYQCQDEFWHCTACDQLYWKGTQWDQIQVMVDLLRTRLMPTSPMIPTDGSEM